MKGSTQSKTQTVDPFISFANMFGMNLPANFMAGSGSKGSRGQAAQTAGQTSGQTPYGGPTASVGPSVAPPMPSYVNYQQMPSYTSAAAGPSQALLNFLSQGYRDGGAVGGLSEDDIANALRIVRLLGELKKT